MVPRLSDFEGAWGVARHIRPNGAAEGWFSGRCSFVREGAALAYREVGELHLEGHEPMKAERRYIWRRGGAGIAVDYADGRPFHSFDPADPVAEHVCPPDIYKVRYDFSNWPEWRAEWVVSGPRKDYTMHTVYTRVEG